MLTAPGSSILSFPAHQNHLSPPVSCTKTDEFPCMQESVALVFLDFPIYERKLFLPEFHGA